ncbi:hypothetical protein SmJEL517_g02142 [Synchytrium microbalum]|uniref:Enhancer of polycomb-like protein n=1 Tax=Synchytrium microbalum TaxID=1806994 RepID=A0A507CC29_9FUNG|nr:uncharacterized protein SmJEL517_g02142 [Synchytrium microbalum]TPX35576.1 hypothetical protein SmJEL517_g02142 [Synchytrium microbalum]
MSQQPKQRGRKGPDLRRSLVVLRWNDVADLNELHSWKRVAGLSTGVEKEEEEEHHLQEALTKNQLGNNAAQVYIPVPDASVIRDDAARFYSKIFHRPKTMIRFSTQLEDCIGCPYNLDEVDDEWLNSYNASIQMENLESNLSEDIFEKLMWVLDKLCSDKVIGEPPTLEEFEAATDSEIARTDAISKARPLVYEHWKKRSNERGNRPVNATLRGEEQSLNPDTDPYVCFRRREVKQMRKTRKTDNQSLDKLQRLRKEMEMAKRLIELVAQREVLRKDALSFEHAVFEQRVVVRRLKKKLGLPIDRDERSPSKKREKAGYKLMIPLGKLRRAGEMSKSLQDAAGDYYQPGQEYQEAYEVSKRQKLDDEAGGWFDAKEEPYIVPAPTQNVPRHYWVDDLPVALVENPPASSYRIPRGRRRVGRGGRVMFDRHVPRSERISWDEPPVPDALYVDNDRNVEEEIWRREERWRHDNFSDDEDEEPQEIEDNPHNMAYRAFYLGATTEIEYRNLVNQPTFKAQFFASPSTPAERAAIIPQPPPQIIKAPSATTGVTGNSPVPTGLPQPLVAAQKNRRPGVGNGTKGSTPTPDIPVKAPTPSPQKRGSTKAGSAPPPEQNLDPRQQNVHAMLAEAQRRAQNTAMLLQQYKSVGGAPGSPTVMTSNTPLPLTNGPSTPGASNSLVLANGGAPGSPSAGLPVKQSSDNVVGNGGNVVGNGNANNQANMMTTQMAIQQAQIFAQIQQQQKQAKIAQLQQAAATQRQGGSASPQPALNGLGMSQAPAVTTQPAFGNFANQQQYLNALLSMNPGGIPQQQQQRPNNTNNTRSGGVPQQPQQAGGFNLQNALLNNQLKAALAQHTMQQAGIGVGVGGGPSTPAPHPLQGLLMQQQQKPITTPQQQQQQAAAQAQQTRNLQLLFQQNPALQANPGMVFQMLQLQQQQQQQQAAAAAAAAAGVGNNNIEQVMMQLQNMAAQNAIQQQLQQQQLQQQQQQQQQQQPQQQQQTGGGGDDDGQMGSLPQTPTARSAA